MKKQFCALLMALLMLLNVPIVMSAKSSPSITLENISQCASDYVDIKINLENNPGIVAANLNVSFSNNLRLVSATNGSTFSTLTYIPPKALADGIEITSETNFTWSGFDIEDADIKNGTILTMRFRVVKGSSNDYQVSVTCESGDVLDRELNPIILNCSIGGADFNIFGHEFTAYVYNDDATATKDGTKTRVCTLCNYSETVTVPGTKLNCPFKDVSSKQYYYDAVLWAVENDITSGTSATKFSPNAPCTRGQIVTFLWRAAGSPDPKDSRNPFKDVSSKQYYYKAVLWAVENGITSGTSKTKFSPNASCTRGQIVAFLWRASGSPDPNNSKNPFKDVSSKQYYYDAVLWAVENKITSGTSATKFSPNSPCTRAQIVTFLYRAYK